MATDSVPSIDPAAADERVRAGAFLLDVREPDEWEAGRAPAATLIPLGTLGAEVRRLPEEGEIVVVCRSGARSAKATKALREAGYEALNLDGGMKAWAAAGLPVVMDSGAPGEVA